MKTYATAFLALLLCACGDERDYWLDGQIREPKAENAPVEVFISQKPTRPYRDIAIVRFETYEKPHRQTDKLKKTCRKLGGDAIIVGSQALPMTQAVVIEYTDTKP